MNEKTESMDRKNRQKGRDRGSRGPTTITMQKG